jgi:hypothetical protein
VTAGINQSIEKYGKTFNRQFIMNTLERIKRLKGMSGGENNSNHPPPKLRGGKNKGEGEWKI